MGSKYFIKIFCLAWFLLFLGMNLYADEAFRKHRFEEFKVLPKIEKDGIVFIGNSITNMMNWGELFGNEAKIYNRGTSGCDTQEIIDNLESMISGRPSKIFLMIGTNDLGKGGEGNSAEEVAYRIKQILTRIKKEQPEAIVYYQSILPTRFGKRNREQTMATNQIIKNWIENYGDEKLQYIDLYGAFEGKEGDIRDWSTEPDETSLSYDNLHLTQKGYKLWGELIKEYVGYEVAVPEEAVNLWGDLNRSNGMRATHFGAFPVTQNDILLVGDEMIANGEWHEIMQSVDFKNRGIGWGYPGVSIKGIKSVFEAIFNGNKDKGVNKSNPKAVVFYAGVSEFLNGKEPEEVISEYKNAIDEMKVRLPETPLFLMTLPPFPWNDEMRNEGASKINAYLRNETDKDSQLNLIDLAGNLYLDNNKRDESNFMNEESIFLNGEGYISVGTIMAQSLNKALGTGYNAISQEEGKINHHRNDLWCENRNDRFVVFDNANSEVPYRIPAIAKNKNGDLIALADYRYSHADIGMEKNGKLDIRYRIKDGKSGEWGEVKTLVAAYGEGDDNVAYGDPCIVADRESSKVLVTSCSGNVSFPKGTPANHQGWATFLSDDGGYTWKEYHEIASQVDSLLSGHKDGEIKAFFIGSGKISQSRKIKPGEYYRIYCAALARTGTNEKVNYVLYSDDFGRTWDLLGEVDDCPVPGGADEAKAEELPDGSVMISSRIKGGRYFNIFQYSDIEKGKGRWGNVAVSDSTVNGVFASSNACNGEIMVLPVKNLENGDLAYLLLQSVPLGPEGRKNVGINYKILDSVEDYSKPENLAKDWDGVYEVTDRSSAYSTMTLDNNYNIAFLYEENVRNDGYDNVYCRFSIPEITNYKYKYSEE